MHPYLEGDFVARVQGFGLTRRVLGPVEYVNVRRGRFGREDVWILGHVPSAVHLQFGLGLGLKVP